MPVKLEIVRYILPFFLLFSFAGAAQGHPEPTSRTPTEAQALVARALATEVRTAQDLNHPMRYRLRKSSPRFTSTKEIAETRDGDVARLVAINDQPLSQEDELREEARLDALLSDPSRQRHRKQSEESDTGIVLKLLRMLPQAFIYEYAGVGQGSAGPNHSEIVEKFRFHPNPAFSPPDLETQALTAMSGELWIDASQERVTRLEGHLQQDTNYGFGILGKLDKGGWIVLEQAEVAAGQWRIARFQIKMELRILFKEKSFDSVQEMTHYAPIPVNLDYRQAIQMLRGAPSAQSGH
jgi:hypothetical protein